MLITQRTLSHIRQLDGPLAARIHEPVAALWVELRRRDHLRQLLHVGGLDVDDVEALILDVEIPQVDPEIITADERLPVAVDRDAVDVIGVGVGIGPTRHGGDDGIMVGQSRELQRGCRGKGRRGIYPRRAPAAAYRTAGGQIV